MSGNDLLQKLTDEIDRTVCESDRRFFDAHPKRNHRLRPASWAEVSMHEIADGVAAPITAGNQMFVAVKQLKPGIRLRAFFIAPAAADWAEPPEDICRAWFEYVYPPGTPKIETALARLDNARTANR